MADILLAGDSPAVQQVKTGALTAYDTGTTYTITVNGKTVSTAGTGGTVTTTAVALVALANASTYPEFAEITWSNSSGSVIATMDTAGKSIACTLTKSGGTGTVTDFSDTTANS